mgnify:CR=1 FL=1
MLKSKQLREMLKEIDNSRQRIRVLQDCLKIEEFQGFANTVMEVLDLVDQEGRIKWVVCTDYNVGNIELLIDGYRIIENEINQSDIQFGA